MRNIILMSLVSLMILLSVLNGLSGAMEKHRLILATATTGGTYYPVGVAIATLTTNNLDASHGVSMTAITSAGSGENIQLLRNREADMAIIQSLYGAMAWQGKGRYRNGAQSYLRSLTVLWENVEHFVILEKYAATGNMSDLGNIRKKNFSIGQRGSGTETSGRVILEALGFSPNKDFKLRFLGYDPSANALQNGRVVGMNIPAGMPASAITQAYAAIGSKDIRVLDFTDEQLAKVNSGYDVWKRTVIKSGTYPGQECDIRTISQANLLAVHQDLDADVVYQITKNIYENLSFLKKIHSAAGEMSLDRAVSGLSVPLHPGALRYYQEKGLSIPSHLVLK
ncbi:MAG: TAXI family TRAP transporter solute-binding subunit [Candidatus Aminicenantes bacterium]|nr:TAXI family TRAP transporter solute-binding subunit [Candidatus Aminicenantes bacterium]